MRLDYRNVFSVKIVAAVLATALAVSFLGNICLKRMRPGLFDRPRESSAEEGKGELRQTPDGLYNYRVDLATHEAIIICYNGAMENHEETAVVPGEIDGCRVTALDECAMSFNEYVRTIVLPPSIKEIRMQCFANCPKLEKIYYSGDSLALEDAALYESNGKKAVSVTIVTKKGNDLWKYAKDRGIPVKEGEYAEGD